MLLTSKLPDFKIPDPHGLTEKGCCYLPTPPIFPDQSAVCVKNRQDRSRRTVVAIDATGRTSAARRDLSPPPREKPHRIGIQTTGPQKKCEFRWCAFDPILRKSIVVLPQDSAMSNNAFRRVIGFRARRRWGGRPEVDWSLGGACPDSGGEGLPGNVRAHGDGIEWRMRTGSRAGEHPRGFGPSHGGAIDRASATGPGPFDGDARSTSRDTLEISLARFLTISEVPAWPVRAAGREGRPGPSRDCRLPRTGRRRTRPIRHGAGHRGRGRVPGVRTGTRPRSRPGGPGPRGRARWG